jgi:ubiquinone/menaquinone biosynthesis C-methylase UbiE
MERGADVIGIDGAPEMVRVAEAVVPAQVSATSLRFQVANVVALPFPDGSFDGVLCSSVLEYADNPATYLSEIARVTKPGGTLLISVPNAESVIRLGLRMAFQLSRLIGRPRPKYMIYSRYQYSKTQFAALLRTHGLESGYVTAFGSGLPDWVGTNFWYGRLLLFRADKPRADRSDTTFT